MSHKVVFYLWKCFIISFHLRTLNQKVIARLKSSKVAAAVSWHSSPAQLLSEVFRPVTVHKTRLCDLEMPPGTYVGGYLNSKLKFKDIRSACILQSLRRKPNPALSLTVYQKLNESKHGLRYGWSAGLILPFEGGRLPLKGFIETSELAMNAVCTHLSCSLAAHEQPPLHWSHWDCCHPWWHLTCVTWIKKKNTREMTWRVLNITHCEIPLICPSDTWTQRLNCVHFLNHFNSSQWLVKSSVRR